MRNSTGRLHARKASYGTFHVEPLEDGLGHGLEIEFLVAFRMRKMKSGNRTSTAKGKRAPKSMDEYLAGVPEPMRSTFDKMRAAIRSAAPPEATETISYRIPAIEYKGVLVWFAAFSSHCSLFPTAAVIEALKNELKGFSTSKGTIHFPRDKPLPTALIKKLVKTRVAQIEGQRRR
jgi:uncharacterized protein YdhG (YjbR/CyaY superfamily)